MVRGEQGLVKIGITRNPNQRLAALQSKSAAPLSFAWIGVPKEQTIAIERDVHTMLAKYRRQGEWFAIEPDAAVGAIHALAFKRGLPVLDLDAQQAARIVQIACQPQRKPSTVLSRVASGILQLIAAFIIVGWMFGFLLLRLL